jgi:hypothetical protein
MGASFVSAEILNDAGVAINAGIEFPAGYTTTHRAILDCRQTSSTRISYTPKSLIFDISSLWRSAILAGRATRREAALAQAVGTTYNR